MYLSMIMEGMPSSPKAFSSTLTLVNSACLSETWESIPETLSFLRRVGTHAFAPPELRGRGGAPYDATKPDVWSLSAVLLLLLCDGVPDDFHARLLAGSEGEGVEGESFWHHFRTGPGGCRCILPPPPGTCWSA